MITIVDYGLGNVRAIANIYRRLQIPVTLASTAEELSRAERIILPGVGAFDWAMKRLGDSGMREVLDNLVLQQGRPVLGICVGMQMMALRSEEGVLPGLGWFDAEVKKFERARLPPSTQLPHMGWNDVRPKKGHGLFRDLGDSPRFYFLHSFHVVPRNLSDVLALTDYGESFASVVGSGRIWGAQFHPEKSHHWGIQILKNFSET